MSGWRHTLLALAVAGAAARAGAQGTPVSASSPLLPCCRVGHDGILPIVDSLVGTLRATGLASSLHELRRGAPDRRVYLVGTRVDGAWHRPQEPAVIDRADAGADGWRALGEWTVAGSAAWRRQREYDVRWRNTSDAYLGSPYVWADADGGTWRGDQVALASAIGSPVWRGFRAGLGGDYGIGQGARRNASRPLYRRRVLELTPALTWSIGAHQLAAGVTRGWHREDLEVGGGAFGDPTIYRMRGISTFDRTQLITAERAVLGDVGGTTIGHAWQTRQWASALSWRRRTELDSVRDGIARPEFGGSSRRVRQDARAVLRRTHARGGLEGLVTFVSEEARGTDPIFRAVNQLDDGTRTQLLLTAWRGATLPTAQWVFAIDGTQHALERRDVVSETRWSTRMHEGGVRALRRTHVATATLLTGVRAAVARTGAAEYEARRPTQLTPILAAEDFAIVSAPRQTLEFLLGAEWGRSADGGPAARTRLEGTVVRGEAREGAVVPRRAQWRLVIELL